MMSTILLLLLLFASGKGQNVNSTCDLPPMRDLYIFPDDTGYGIRYYSNVDLSQESNVMTQIRKLIWVIHGDARNADDYYIAMCGAAKLEGYNVTNYDILIVAPRFMDPDDNFTSTEFYWATGAWIPGNNSLVPQNVSLQQSSFDIIDKVTYHLLVTYGTLYPNIINVTIAGHSGGGQFAQRYALVNRLSNYINTEKYHIKYVPANPSSFCYLDSRRWFNNEIYRELTASEISACPEYNMWKFGYASNSHFPLYILSQNLTLNTVKSNYKARNVTYLHGTSDVCNSQENSSCSDGGLDTTCMDMYGGNFRLERGVNFLRSLMMIYGTYIHRIQFVPFVGHDHVDMFQHPQGRRAIF